MMRQFVSDVGRIDPARITGTCAKHQRKLTTEISLARQMALIPYDRIVFLIPLLLGALATIFRLWLSSPDGA